MQNRILSARDCVLYSGRVKFSYPEAGSPWRHLFVPDIKVNAFKQPKTAGFLECNMLPAVRYSVGVCIRDALKVNDSAFMTVY